MLKMALLDCAINEKFCSVDRGRAFALFFRPHPRELMPSKAKKLPMPGGQPGRGGEGVGPSWVKLTDALITNLDLYCAFKKVPQEKCLI